MTHNDMIAMTPAINNAIKAVCEEEELESLVEVLGDGTAQSAAHGHTLPVLVATMQIDEVNLDD